MRKAIISGLAAAAILGATACAGNETANTNPDNQIFESQEQQGADNSEDLNAQNTDGTASSGSASPLYKEFEEGTASVKYTGKGDRTSYITTYDVLEAGKSYTKDELLTALKSIGGLTEDGEPSFDFTEIDCGEDGVPELLVTIEFGAASRLIMILKDIDGELVMCFDQDGWDRSDVFVNPDGTISTYGSAAANVHVFDSAFVDASGEYKFYYGYAETLTLYGDYYAYTNGSDYTIISADGLDGDHLGLRDYYFEADFEKREHFHSYFFIDDEYNEVSTEDDYNDSNPIQQKFAEAGIKTYTPTELNKMVDERAIEIGYPSR